jgi:hypothetical protein
MAWRIEETLIKGELDNRIQGRVTGRLWFAGRGEPLVLELVGDTRRDLAGQLLRFTNPSPRPPRPGELADLATLQRGRVGDITASRKVKVPDCSMDELRAHIEDRRPFPWHWSNSLHLEWYSEANGRVVIESASYLMEVEPGRTWVMNDTAEAAQREANDREMLAFMERLAGAANEPDCDAPTSPAEANADAEAARMELLLDRVIARMEREGLEAEAWERILNEERARLRRERGEPDPEPPTPEEQAAKSRWLAELNAAELSPAEDEDHPRALRDDDWHPLVARCNALTRRLSEDVILHGWLAPEDTREHPLRELINGVMLAGAKLAGALGLSADAREWPPEPLFAGPLLVRLKKARGGLRDALAGLDAADEQDLAEAGWRAGARADIAEIFKTVDRLVAEARAVLEKEPD